MTLYEKTINEMTEEKFALLNVKPVVINGNEMFYVTTSGQLFPFTNEGLQNAVNYQYQILMQQLPEESTNKDSNADHGSVKS